MANKYTKNFTVQVTPELHKRLKIAAVVSERRMTEIISEAIDRYVAQMEDELLAKKEAHESSTR